MIGIYNDPIELHKDTRKILDCEVVKFATRKGKDIFVACKKKDIETTKKIILSIEGVYTVAGYGYLSNEVKNKLHSIYGRNIFI